MCSSDLGFLFHLPVVILNKHFRFFNAKQRGALHAISDDNFVELAELADFSESDFVAPMKIGGSQNILPGFEGQKNFFQGGQHGAFDNFNAQRP